MSPDFLMKKKKTFGAFKLCNQIKYATASYTIKVKRLTDFGPSVRRGDPSDFQGCGACPFIFKRTPPTCGTGTLNTSSFRYKERYIYMK